jgi:transcriptional regulator with XRE-family HTH domain
MRLERKADESLWLLATNLRRLREARGYFQTELARRSGVPNRYISSIEKGSQNVTLAMLEALATGLDCALYDLFAPVKRNEPLLTIPLRTHPENSGPIPRHLIATLRARCLNMPRDLRDEYLLISQLCRYRRLRAGLSQQELADRAQLHISRVILAEETGQTLLPSDQNKLGTALGLPGPLFRDLIEKEVDALRCARGNGSCRIQ